jgi:hypothetical protein
MKIAAVRSGDKDVQDKEASSSSHNISKVPALRK